jgi:hypothetical protein
VVDRISSDCIILESRYMTQEEFEDTKMIIRIRKSKKDRHHNGKKGQTMIYKALQRPLTIKQHEPCLNQEFRGGGWGVDS